MKITIQNLIAALILLAVSPQTRAQGTLVYDQQSATGPVAVVGNGNADGLYIQEDSPLVQSFIPTLSAIEFAQLEFEDPLLLNNGNNGATVYVNLLSGSSDPRFGATLLGSTAPVYMPDGFGFTGGGIGITNFYFSTPVVLTAGQTYYIQPVVLSGDDPWDIMAIGNTYPNGQVFAGGASFNTDFWFREGIVSVPEPSILALACLTGILAFSFKRLSKLFIVSLFVASILSIHAIADSVVQATADEAGLTPVSATSLPRIGTFWIMTVSSNGRLIALPYPTLPSSISTLPIYSVAGKGFIVDDTGGQLMPASAGRMSTAQAASTAQTQVTAMDTLLGQILYPGTNGFGTNEISQPNGSGLMIDTNGLWLESSNEDNYLGLRLHNPAGDNYQLLSISNLLNTNWDLGEILYGASGDYADFTPVPMTNAVTFFKVHQANPVMWIWSAQDSREPDSTNDDAGQVGVFYIQNEGSATNDVIAYYSISGTAQNGIDYSNLTGMATVSNSLSYAKIDIDPIADGLKPDQTVVLTLIQNTNYLIDTSLCSATNNLQANPQVYPTIRGDKESPCPDTQWPINLASDANDPRGLPLTYTVLSWPIHGTLITNDIPFVTYTSTNCYEGQDSFTFEVSDGQYTSAPATVTLTITNQVYAYPAAAQTCRGMSVPFYLSAGDNGCGEATNYIISAPSDGTVSNISGQNFVYIPNDTNFTGIDSFDYIVYDNCGDAATNTVTITVGDEYLYGNDQSIMTPTNQPVAVTLSAVDTQDGCIGDTNDYTYTLISSLTNGYLTGTPPNLTYVPTNGEGFDSFQFYVSDGAWTSSYPATVKLYVVAGPILTADCDPFGTAVQLDWRLDDAVSNMWQQDHLSISDFVVYRSTNSGGPYMPIAITNAYQTSYLDTNAVVGQTNYYVVNFESPASAGTNYESPFSNEIEASGQNPDDLIAPNAIWDVVTNLDDPTSVTNLQAPFSSYGTNQYPGLYPLPNTYWPPTTTWSNYITMFIPSNSVPLSQVFYSIAIDNDYQLYLNDSNAPIEIFNHEGDAVWSPLKSFQDVAPGLLHYGTNDIRVVITDEAEINYFSMIVTTNTCGW